MCQTRIFIDLSEFLNTSLDENIHDKLGNDLKEVPRGSNEFAGTLFDVQGLIQLSGSISKEKTGIDFPSEAKKIAVNGNGKQISFLHGSSWHEKGHTVIGEYKIRFINDHIEIVPIVYEGNVVDWWFMPNDKLPLNAVVAWTGENERTRSQGYQIQFYKYTWINPLPNIEIKDIDFITTEMESAPFLIAATLE
ncbi:MAG: hypothetical protein PF517_01825 [Salinivirgaceae bacterium]|jgi:hypothetical protein|nr:hypothetical protein [Salinivirgaceae bacterium]